MRAAENRLAGPPLTTQARAQALMDEERLRPGGVRVWHHVPGPQSIGPLDPHIFITGAALARTGIDSVWVRVDEGPPRRARFGRPNERVREVFPDEYGPDSGDWMIAIDAAELQAGEHEVQALAVSRGGAATLARRPLEVDLERDYRRWRQTRRDRPPRSGASSRGVRIAVLLLSEGAVEPGAASDGMRSLLAQTHTQWRLALVGDARLALEDSEEWRELAAERRLGDGCIEDLEEALQALAPTETTHVVFAGLGDRLAPRALAALASQARAGLVYCDEDTLGSDPFFKPDFSPELLLAWNYIGTFFLVEVERLRRARNLEERPFSCAYDVLLRLLGDGSPPSSTDERLGVGHEGLGAAHVPEVFRTRACPRPPGTEGSDWELERQSVLHLAARRGAALEIERGQLPRTRKLRWKLGSEPLVSIVIPTAGGGEVLERCLQSLAERTSYERIEVVLVDTTAGTTPIDVSALAERAHRIVPCARPFNYSVANNLGTLAARGEVLLYLNDDTQALNHDWIERMLGWLEQPGVGIVGAKLLYPEGLIQHLGVFFATPGPSHTGVLLDADAPGYMGLLTVPRNCSAVTGACLMTARETYEAIGGFDEQLAVEYGDIDFCLTARRDLGLRAMVTPDAQLIHLENITRGMVAQPADRRFFGARWPAQMYGEERFFPREPMRP